MKSIARFGVVLLITFGSFSFVSAEQNSKSAAQLKYTKEFILQEILNYKKLNNRSDIQIPEVVKASEATLKQFQDDVEPQWHMRPEFITNVYVVHLNKIYIYDDSAYYDRLKRCIDDSLAHELTHFIQVKYRGWDLNDDSLEADAVDTQTWFRENHCKFSN